MTEGNVRPDVAKQVTKTIRSVSELQRRRLPSIGDVLVPHVTFSYPGALAGGVESPPWYNEGAAFTVVQVRVSLGAAATTDHSVEVRLNGVNTITAICHTGNISEITPSIMEVRQSDYLTVVTVSVTDANLSVILLAQ